MSYAHSEPGVTPARARPAPRRRVDDELAAPLVTISREYGSRGGSVGRVVAQRLDFDCWSNPHDQARHDRAALEEVVARWSERGRAVLIGRGLGYLVDPDRALRVRIVCPFELRVAGLAERQGLSLDTARATVAYADRSRADYVRALFGRDIDDPTGYDLWLSTGAYSIDAAAAVVLSAYRYRFGEEVMRAIGHHQHHRP